MRFKYKILWVLGSLTFSLFLQGQTKKVQKIERNVPLVVLEAFNKTYQGKDPVWFSSYQGRDSQKLVFEGKFLLDNRYCVAIYDINGNQLAFAASVEYKEVPEAARIYMTENYPTIPVVQRLLVTSSKKIITYELGVYIDNEFVIMVFSKEGDFIKITRG
ncbi:hypothetical protein [Flavobacterium faecale]|uniref:hypothetical protein n=1 Tax=Flavobacterium faecale TaxID=1355330 RepID=UPI003AAF5079